MQAERHKKEKNFFRKIKNYSTGAWGEIEKDRKYIKCEQAGTSRFKTKKNKKNCGTGTWREDRNWTRILKL